jgi:hypothetical protein
MRKLILGGVLAALVMTAVGCKLVVTPTAPNGWSFLNEGANGSGYYVNGPGVPPVGRGSALLTVDGTGREGIATGLYSGAPLSALTQLKYSTYQAYSGSAGETPNMAFDVDYDSTDSSTAYQGRLVFVPSAGSTVQPRVWQNWDAMGGDVSWYSSGSGGSGFRPIVGDQTEANPPCNQTTFCDWATVLGHYPHARIRPKVNSIPGAFLIRIGGPIGGGFSGATDNVIVGIGSQVVENNFEPGDGHIAVGASSAAGLGFGFAQETPTGSGAFVGGPNGSDGSGSARLTVDSDGGESLATGVFAGTRLDRLTFLSYKTYMAAAGSNAPTVQFDVDYDDTDGSTAFQGRAVFEPSMAGEAQVTNETWQTWNPLTATSGWWQTGNAIVSGNNVWQACTQGSPCSLAQLLFAYPNARIRPITNQSGGQPVAGGIWLKAGSNWSGGFDGNVDSLTVGVKVGTVNGTVTYDFEP